MKIAICIDNESFNKNKILELKFAKSQDALWIPKLCEKLEKLGFEIATGDIALNKIKTKKWVINELFIIQYYSSKYGSKLIKLGAKPIILILDESPIILFRHYDYIANIINQFKYYSTYPGISKLLKKRSKITSKFVNFYCVSYEKNEFNKIINKDEIKLWDKRNL